MPQIFDTKIVPFAADNMYRAVADIESYPRILNFIRGIDILERSGDAVKARVFVGLPVLNFSYDCLVEFTEPESIVISLISGPFRKLQASWRFEPLGPERCKVHYALDSRFSNPLMERTAGAIFATQLNHSIKAFENVLKRS